MYFRAPKTNFPSSLASFLEGPTFSQNRDASGTFLNQQAVGHRATSISQKYKCM